MKLSIFILIASLMQVSAAGFAQKITLNQDKASLKQIFAEIKKQTGYDVFYQAGKVKEDKVIKANFLNTPLEEVMEKCLEGQSLSFTIDEKTVLIKEKESTFLERLADRWAAIDVHGRVVDQEGKPLPGATVKVKSTGKSVSTNGKGEFYLEKIDEGVVLLVSFIGYVNKEVSASKEMGNIALELSDSKLDEVQVIAYGETTRRLSTGNVTTIKAEDIEKQPVNNPLLALQGRVSGLYIEQSSGLPGTGVKVLIQGQNSIGWGNDPFYVIDGVPYSAQLLPNLGSILGRSTVGGGPPAGSGSPFSFINPLDIESIEVLKDADATAIYGSRAANGAILITTKKGKIGQTKIDLNLQNGVGQVGHKLQLLGTQQYLGLRNEAFKNDNLDPQFYDYDVNGVWDSNRYTDWQKEFIGGTASYTDLQANVSGGNVNTQFLIGSNYHRETTVFPGNLADQKASVHFNINNTSGNQKFKVQFSGNYVTDRNKLTNNDLTYDAIATAPNAPALYNLNGDLNWAADKDNVSSWYNPLAYLERKFNTTTTNLLSNLSLSYQAFSDLTIKAGFGYNNLESNEVTTNPQTAAPPEERSTRVRRAQFGNNNSSSWIIEPQLIYNKHSGKSHFNVLIGGTLQQKNDSRKLQEGRGFSTDLLLEDIGSATSIIIPTGGTIAREYKYNALFARLTYDFNDTYIVNLTGRRDGSSRFGSANQLHNFGALGVAWIFSNEKLIKDHFSFLSSGKLRGSIGTVGNDQIGDYSYLSQYIVVKPEVPYQGANGLEPDGIPNPYLQWEETKKLQLGLEIGFFTDRILFNFNYFDNRSSNQLLGYVMPSITGVKTINSNFPATVKNSGLELTINTDNVRSKNFRWSTNFNLTTSRNKLLAFANLATSSYSRSLVIGEPLTVQKVFESSGVNSQSGLYQFRNIDGNITAIPNTNFDRTVLININPRYYGGIQNNLSYKAFEIDFMFQFVKQLGTDLLRAPDIGRIFNNLPISSLKHWMKSGDEVRIQRPFTGLTPDPTFASFFAKQSDLVYTDASFLRLKNISFSWTVPTLVVTKMHLKGLRFYIQGQNIFTVTNYQGLDPETQSLNVLPPLRVWTLGLRATL